MASVRTPDHVFTGLCDSDEEARAWIGQIHQSPRHSSAHIHYLLSPPTGDLKDFVALVERLIVEAGHWGAKNIVAEMKSDSETFPLFRRVGFSVLTKFRIYRFELPLGRQPHKVRRWRIWNSKDIHNMRNLYFTLIPPLIQPVEPLTRREMLGLVYYGESGVLQAYADLVYGPVGVWVLPFIHPQTSEDIVDLLAQLILDLPDLAGRPVYIVARSYQPWIESALKNLPAEVSPEHVLMSRYLALRQRVGANIPFAVLENGKTEPTIPFTPIKRHQKKSG